VFRRPFKGIHDLVKVPLRVGLGHGIPDRFLGKNRPSLLDGGGFPVAGPQVEADAAALPMAAQRRGRGARRREVLGCDDREGALVNPFAHDVGIESARGRFLEISLQPRAQVRRPVKINAEAAAGPEQEFEQPFQVEKIASGRRVMGRKDVFGEMKNRAVRLFQSDANGHGGLGRERAAGQRGRAKARFQGRRKQRRPEHKTFDTHARH
jgi:hypothetical protein